MPIGIAAFGADSVQLAAEHADCMIATAPDNSPVNGFDEAEGAGEPKYGQLAICYHPDAEVARDHGRRLWRYATSGWNVLFDLPDPRAFDAASRNVRAEAITEMVPCGPDTEQHVAAARSFTKADFTHLAFGQVGADLQDQFICMADRELLPALRTRVGPRRPAAPDPAVLLVAAT